MTIHILPDVTVIYILIFARFGATMMLIPAIGESSIPTQVRLGIALTLSILIYPVVARAYPAGLAQNFATLMVYVAGEIAVGIAVGVATSLIMSASQIAGTIIANQLGLGFAQSVDPSQGQQGVLFGNFLSMLAVTSVFVTNLHHLAIMAATSSFTMFPPGNWMPTGDFAQAAISLVGEAFQVGIQISSPFLAFGLVFYLGLGVLSKLMPQFQIFFAAMPLNIIAGLVLFSMLVGTLTLWYMEHVRDGFARLVPH
jgi:flagellar biosynthetic protein FliR